MSDVDNKVLTVSLDAVDQMIEKCQTFLLCFIKSKNDMRTASILQACNNFCENFPSVRCYATDYDEYNRKYPICIQYSLYMVLSYENGKILGIVKGGFEIPLFNLFRDIQTKLNTPKTILQQSEQEVESDEPANSKGNESGASNRSLENIHDKDEKKSKTTMHNIQHLAPSVSSSQVLPNKHGSTLYSRYKITNTSKLKIRNSAVKSSGMVKYPSVRPFLPEAPSHQLNGTTISVSSEKSTPAMLESHYRMPKLTKKPILSQTSQTSSLITPKRTPPRLLDSRTKLYEKPQFKYTNSEHQTNSNSKQSPMVQSATPAPQHSCSLCKSCMHGHILVTSSGSFFKPTYSQQPQASTSHHQDRVSCHQQTETSMSESYPIRVSSPKFSPRRGNNSHR